MAGLGKAKRGGPGAGAELGLVKDGRKEHGELEGEWGL